MCKSSSQYWLSTLTFILSLACFQPSYGEEYYRWIGEDGVIHYGSRPPEGVEAEKVSTYGKSLGRGPDADITPKDAQADSKQAPKQQDVVTMRLQQCDEERERLRALQTPGTRIRMEQDDGSARYLTPEEIAREISNSEEFLNQACQQN